MNFTPEHLVKKVKEMQEAQKQYSRTKSPVMFDRSKHLERQVDSMVEMMLKDKR